jgi:hypothetical protein
MLPHRSLAVIFAVATAVPLGCAGCASEPRPAARPVAVQAAAAPAPEATGQPEMQGTSSLPPSATAPTAEESPLPPLPAPAPDAIIAVRPDGTPVTAVQIAAGGKVQVPAGASLTASVEVSEVRAFPEEAVEDTAAVDGRARSYQTQQTYLDTVGFFDRSLSTGGFQVAGRAATTEATVWSVRCPGGERAHIAVRRTSPTTVEIVEASR